MNTDVWRYDPGTATAAARAVTQALVDACALRRTSDVLDLACGGGNPSVHIASTVATEGTVVATDIDMRSLSVLAQLLRRQRIGNLVHCLCTSNRLPFPAGWFDAATCRFGVMFFPDVSGTLTELHRVLRRGAKLAFAVFGPKRFNPLYTSVEAAFDDLGVSAASYSERVFRFSEGSALEEALAATGFCGVYAIDVAGEWGDTSDVQIRHLLRRTYRPAMVALDAQARLAFIALLREGLTRKRDARQITWHFRIVCAER